MPRGLTQEEVENYLIDNGCELIDKYIRNNLEIKIKCRCGHFRTSKLTHIKSYKQFYCKDCTSNTPKHIHEKKVETLKKQFESKYIKTLNYRDDFIEENYNQTFICWDCGLTKNRKNFPYRKQYSFNKEKRCKMCNNENHRKRRNEQTEKQLIHEIIERSKLLSKKRYGNGRKECGDFDIDVEYIIELSKKQNNICVYSGRILEWKTNSENKLSIDRIDSKKGYTKDNVQLVCKIVNQAKSDMSENEFITFIEEIYNKKEKKNFEDSENIPDIKKIKKLIKISKQSARKHKITGRIDAGIHLITIDDIINISHKQNNCCIYSGNNLWNSKEKPSIDRINSELGYIKSNIQLVTFKANQAKSNLNESDFMKLISDIYTHVRKNISLS